MTKKRRHYDAQYKFRGALEAAKDKEGNDVVEEVVNGVQNERFVGGPVDSGGSRIL